jgi:hypothetical protein
MHEDSLRIHWLVLHFRSSEPLAAQGMHRLLDAAEQQAKA